MSNPTWNEEVFARGSRRRRYWIVAAVLLVGGGGWFGNSYAEALERADAAEDSVLVLSGALRPLEDAATALRDSVAASEATVEAVRDSVAGIIAESDTVLVAQLDTIRELVQDTTALRIIDEMESTHALRLASKDSVIAVQDAQIQQQKRLLGTSGQIIANLELQVDQLQDANHALRDALKSKGRATWIERGGVVLVAAALLAR